MNKTLKPLNENYFFTYKSVLDFVSIQPESTHYQPNMLWRTLYAKYGDPYAWRVGYVKTSISAAVREST